MKLLKSSADKKIRLYENENGGLYILVGNSSEKITRSDYRFSPLIRIMPYLSGNNWQTIIKSNKEGKSIFAYCIAFSKPLKVKKPTEIYGEKTLICIYNNMEIYISFKDIYKTEII